MSKLKDLFKQHDLSTIKYPHTSSSKTPLDRALLTQAYGDKLRKADPNYPHSASVACDCKHSYSAHYLVGYEGKIAYDWSGQSYLVSKTVLPLDVLHEAIKLKQDELAAARKKRFETVKTPRDAVRITFRDLGIEHKMQGGVPRVDCGSFDLEFSVGEESPEVTVSMVYRDYYVGRIELVTLNIADPDFNKKVEAVAFNGLNLKKLLVGEIQPKSLK